jgi:RNA polymerase sigma-54 factor
MKNGQLQKMKMQQKLSPQQLLLMRLLQLPVTDLEQRLKEEVEKNPMLEVSTEPSNMVESLPKSSIENSGADEGIDTEDDDYSYRERQERDKNQDVHEPVFVSEATFGDHLMEQLSMRNLTPR